MAAMPQLESTEFAPSLEKGRIPAQKCVALGDRNRPWGLGETCAGERISCAIQIAACHNNSDSSDYATDRRSNADIDGARHHEPS
jgi:hypothetical protein